MNWLWSIGGYAVVVWLVVGTLAYGLYKLVMWIIGSG